MIKAEGVLVSKPSTDPSAPTTATIGESDAGIILGSVSGAAAGDRILTNNRLLAVAATPAKNLASVFIVPPTWSPTYFSATDSKKLVTCSLTSSTRASNPCPPVSNVISFDCGMCRWANAACS